MDFLTADLHCYHRNILKYEPERPWDNTEDMNEGLIEYHNSIVRSTDRCFYLGDIIWGGVERCKSIVQKLNGYKICILGNHDRGKSVFEKAGFNEVHKGYVDLKIAGLTIRLSHYPFAPTPSELEEYKQKGYAPKYLNRRPPHEDCDYLLCGHVHSAWKLKSNEFGKQLNVGVDVWNYKPVMLTEALYTLGLDVILCPKCKQLARKVYKYSDGHTYMLSCNCTLGVK